MYDPAPPLPDELRPPKPDASAACVACPRCGCATTDAELTYSGCPVCQAEAEADAAQDIRDAVPRWRIALNFVQAKLHRAYPCATCGYRYCCREGCHS